MKGKNNKNNDNNKARKPEISEETLNSKGDFLEPVLLIRPCEVML